MENKDKIILPKFEATEEPAQVENASNESPYKVDDSILETLFNAFGATEGASDIGFESISALLSMPDDQFDILAPIFILEMEKALNNPNDKILLGQSLASAGISVQEFISLYNEMMCSIDKQLSDVLTKDKVDFLKQLIGIVANSVSETVGTTSPVVQIPIEFCGEDAKMPAYARVGDAGLDVFSTQEMDIMPGQTVLIPLNIKVAIPIGHELQVRPKSGLSLKTKMRISNSPGTIDSGYRDNVGILIDNIDPSIKDITYHFVDENLPTQHTVIDSILHGSPYHIDKGQKIAQIVLAEYKTVNFFEVGSVAEIGENRGGGFGHTGLK